MKRGRKSKWTDAQKARMVMLAKKNGFASTAKAHGLSAPTIYSWANGWAKKSRAKNGPVIEPELTLHGLDRYIDERVRAFLSAPKG